MKLKHSEIRISFLFAILLLVAGCKALTSEQHATIPNPDCPYSFNKPPFINPRIIQDVTTEISDRGDQVVAINLLDSQDSNRYFGETGVKQIQGQNPYIFTSTTNIQDTETNITAFGYEFVGRTSSGVYVLEVGDWEGGSGSFKNLLFVTFEYDRGIDCDWNKAVVQFKGKRLLIKKLGEVALGDRWDGKLKIRGDCLYVGQDKGVFAGTERGGELSHYRTNRVMKIDLER